MRGFVHNPARCYYQIRNCFLLFNKENVPFLLACQEILSSFVHHMILFAIVDNKVNYFRNYFLAVLHGIRGINGKKPS